MTNDNDLEANWVVAKEMIERASERSAKMIFFPEAVDYVGRTREEEVSLAIEEESEFINRFRELAKKHTIWMSLGGFHRKDNDLLPFNTHLIIDSEGKTATKYDKLHLFDLEIPGKVRLMESEFSKAGSGLIPPVETPVGRLGLSICYDVRFPELSIFNRKQGAHILSFPSAFTLNTGLAHWEVLLRARAIENQCYVVAAAQTGKHNEKRQSYGHAMVVDPWGAVIAQCSERVGMAFAEIDLDYVDEIRQLQPVYSHRRHELYSLHFNLTDKADSEDLHFSQHLIKKEYIFARSAFSYAFVNLKPVLNGHVLVAPLRVVKHLTEISNEETADLFNLSKKVQKMLEAHYSVDSCTVCVQDGPKSGQTIEHVHVHILPRRADDFGGSTDTVYRELAKHDIDDRKPRTDAEMETEAVTYRSKMYGL
ncbi:unnamed protein product, partial [Mesorhabditis belari]|uniref:Nitrilase and fragile histidine triad fusion protein NitFhit n=1 Tax=Mesorhabditis belari TaxID=2138241 RepID=A0AAF3FBP2_9BILA